jgi:hypothetical protein
MQLAAKKDRMSRFSGLSRDALAPPGPRPESRPSPADQNPAEALAPWAYFRSFSSHAGQAVTAVSILLGRMGWNGAPASFRPFFLCGFPPRSLFRPTFIAESRAL